MQAAVSLSLALLAGAPAPASPAPAKPADKPAAAALPTPAPVLRVTGFSTPEGVVYDADNDRYLVSNINGRPLDKDNNGYVSVVSPEGKVTSEKWIASGTAGVTLHAPKGMGLLKGVLYVADIDVVRLFDAKTGTPQGEIALPGATFVNDIAVDAKSGRVFVSDSGMKQGAKDLEGTGTDAVWVLDGKSAKPFYAAKDLGRPNGLWIEGGVVYANFFGSAEICALDAKKGKQACATAPNGGGDGLFVGADGTVWSSSWGGQAVYKGKIGGTFSVAIANVAAPADFAIDTKRNRVVVPRFMDNAVEIFALASAAPAKAPPASGW